MKKDKKNYLRIFISAIMAGVAICIGAIANLSCDNRLVGALIFSIGLFIVLVNKYSLFTGAVCFLFKKGGTGILDALIIFLGNAAGAAIAGLAINFTRLDGIIEKAQSVVAVKSNDGILSIFILAFFCNMLIYYAVNGFRENAHQSAKYIGIILLIPAFIISSYEHCVANMCYMAIAGNITKNALIALAAATVGNSVGGISVRLITDYVNKS